MAFLDPLLKNRNTLFWTLHVSGWLAYALSQYLGTLLYDEKYQHMKGYLTVIVIATIVGFLLSLELRYVYRRLWTRPPRVIMFVALLSCYLFALLWRVIINSAYLQFTSDSMEWEMKSALEFFSGAMHSSYLLLCWTGIYFGIKYY
jgi:two-component system LytT family sensor kinase